jgi:osmotically inducible protein OsmC
MIVRKARVSWAPNDADGGGTIHPESGAFTATYSRKSRFESEPGTNAEELLAAAHASCFGMALAGSLSRAGHVPNSLETTAAVHMDKAEDGYHIIRIDLTVVGDVPGIEEPDFLQHARDMKVNCPISRALKAVDIFLEAKLV